MKKTRKPKAAQSVSPTQKIEANTLSITVKPGEDWELTKTKVVFGPVATNAFALQKFCKSSNDERSIGSILAAMADSNKTVNANDLRDVEATLMSQATVLNTMFGELTRRAAHRINAESFQLDVVETYFKMAMKAQNQCRMTLETLSNIKNPPAVFAKQANIAHGPQQVNNGANPRAPATENHNPPNKLLEQINEQRMDIGTQGQAGGSNSTLEAVGAFDRTKVV